MNKTLVELVWRGNFFRLFMLTPWLDDQIIWNERISFINTSWKVESLFTWLNQTFPCKLCKVIYTFFVKDWSRWWEWFSWASEFSLILFDCVQNQSTVNLLAAKCNFFSLDDWFWYISRLLSNVSMQLTIISSYMINDLKILL